MRLRIHHGARQIGGNCIELECDGHAVLLDLGLPLDSAPVMPPVAGLESPDPSLLGVILSHPHLDHYGLLPSARPDLPVWLGEGAKRLLGAAAPFTAGAVLPQSIATYRDRWPFEVGPFRVTPYLMDHSAFDAHGLLVEAGGKRLFYTGDFRAHGRKSKVFERFVASPPADIDVLLMEGTTISRDEPAVAEADVEAQAAELMRATEGLMLLCFSGQNIDRFVTFLRASVRAGRTLVVDAYMAALIAAVGMKGLSDVRDHSAIRIFLPKSQKAMIVRDQRFDLIEPYGGRRVFLEHLNANPERYAVMFRASMARDLDGVGLGNGGLIYSLWPGYLDRDRTDLRAWSRERGLSFHIVHSSGHASKGDLRRMAEAIAPKRLIPIHTERPEAYRDFWPSVQLAPNGAWIEV